MASGSARPHDGSTRPRARDGLWRIVVDVKTRFGERVLERFAAAFERLESHPEAGRARADLPAEGGVRVWTVGPGLVAFRREASGGVEVSCVERASRDWAELLVEDSDGAS